MKFIKLLNELILEENLGEIEANIVKNNVMISEYKKHKSTFDTFSSQAILSDY